MQLSEDKPYDDINITPMLDLAYVLLVIFILMTTSSVQGLRATLPKASNAPSQPNKEKPKTKIVIVENDGTIIMDKKTLTLDQLDQALRQHKSVHPDFPVMIRGDRQTQYQIIMGILDRVVSIGIKNIGLPTKPKA
jgi:biopolymer transport protein ExbD